MKVNNIAQRLQIQNLEIRSGSRVTIPNVATFLRGKMAKWHFIKVQLFKENIYKKVNETSLRNLKRSFVSKDERNRMINKWEITVLGRQGHFPVFCKYFSVVASKVYIIYVHLI